MNIFDYRIDIFTILQCSCLALLFANYFSRRQEYESRSVLWQMPWYVPFTILWVCVCVCFCLIWTSKYTHSVYKATSPGEGEFDDTIPAYVCTQPVRLHATHCEQSNCWDYPPFSSSLWHTRTHTKLTDVTSLSFQATLFAKKNDVTEYILWPFFAQTN